MTGQAASLDAMTASGFAPLAAAVADGRLPGAVLGVIDRAGGRGVRWAGHAIRAAQPDPVTRATWFDLASLTKVLLTVPAILRQVESGALDLADPISRPLPDFCQVSGRADLRGLTITQLLTHSAGLPAWAPLYSWGNDPQQLKALVLQRDWPLGGPVYSDIGFILLGLVIERLTQTELADQPLPEGLTARPDPASCAATESCLWRRRVLRGETHDENAFALGGLAGHAGLFGTIDGVLDVAAGLLSGKGLSPAALAAMRRPRTATRALGWQVPHDQGVPPVAGQPAWTGGSLCSPSSIGHTGFTGTGLWLDLERGYAWAVLTNRVHPSRHAETGIQDLKRAVGNRLAGCWTAG